MACAPCQQQRRAFSGAVRNFDLRGAGRALRTAAQINIDKMRGVDVSEKYGGGNVVKAKPYRRPTDRTT